MKKNIKPRHWLGIVLAVATLIVAIIAFADFSGNAPPRWRTIANFTLLPLTLAMLFLNLKLDKKI